MCKHIANASCGLLGVVLTPEQIESCVSDARAIDSVTDLWPLTRKHFESRMTSRIEGEMASEAYATVMGTKRVVVIGRGDGGVDFEDGTNCKASSWDRPSLIVNTMQDHSKTVRFALWTVKVDTGDCRLVGVIPLGVAMGYPPRDFGYGKVAMANRTMPYGEIVKYHRGNPARDCVVCGAKDI